MGILSKDGDLKFKDTITKQDLVEYAITKKVEEITALRTDVYKQYKTKSKEREEVKNKIEQAKADAEAKHIQDNYGDVIKLMEMKKGTTHQVISGNSDVKGELYYMIADALRDNILIVIPNQVKESKSDKATSRKSCGGWNHPRMFNMSLYDAYPEEIAGVMLATLGTVITIPHDEINNDEVNSLKTKFDELDAECKSLDKKKRTYDTKISKVRGQKDVIKANIVEQALSNTKDGNKMLESLQNIDFGIGDIKLITTKKIK